MLEKMFNGEYIELISGMTLIVDREFKLRCDQYFQIDLNFNSRLAIDDSR